jgi:DNA primase
MRVLKMNMKQTAAEVKRHITCKDILSYHGVQYAGSNIRCPLPDHEDQNPSFGLYDDARKFKCHGCDRGGDCIELERLIAGCQPGEAIKRLAEKTGLRTEGHAKTMVAAYDYHNETGKLVFQVVRYEPKDFRQRKPDGHGGWVWNIKGITPPLFRLSGVRSAIAAEETVYICEGEKDVETLVSFGLTATTNAGGANKWADRYTDEFRDADVILVPDTDEAGQKHALKLAESLQGVAKVLRILSIPKGKDVSEWVESGGSPDQFAALVTNAQIVTPALMEELRNQVGEEIDPRQLEKEFDTQLSDVWFDGKWYWRKIRDAYEPFSRLDTKL